MTIESMHDNSFSQYVQHAKLPSLILFTHPTCHYCTKIHPEIEQLSSIFSGRLQVAKMDTSESITVPDRFNIRSVPAMILLDHRGNEVDRRVGYMTLRDMVSFLEPYLRP